MAKIYLNGIISDIIEYEIDEGHLSNHIPFNLANISVLLDTENAYYEDGIFYLDRDTVKFTKSPEEKINEFIDSIEIDENTELSDLLYNPELDMDEVSAFADIPDNLEDLNMEDLDIEPKNIEKVFSRNYEDKDWTSDFNFSFCNLITGQTYFVNKNTKLNGSSSRQEYNDGWKATEKLWVDSENIVCREIFKPCLKLLKVLKALKNDEKCHSCKKVYDFVKWRKDWINKQEIRESTILEEQYQQLKEKIASITKYKNYLDYIDLSEAEKTQINNENARTLVKISTVIIWKIGACECANFYLKKLEKILDNIKEAHNRTEIHNYYKLTLTTDDNKINNVYKIYTGKNGLGQELPYQFLKDIPGLNLNKYAFQARDITTISGEISEFLNEIDDKNIELSVGITIYPKNYSENNLIGYYWGDRVMRWRFSGKYQNSNVFKCDPDVTNDLESESLTVKYLFEDDCSGMEFHKIQNNVWNGKEGWYQHKKISLVNCNTDSWNVEGIDQTDNNRYDVNLDTEIFKGNNIAYILSTKLDERTFKSQCITPVVLNNGDIKTVHSETTIPNDNIEIFKDNIDDTDVILYTASMPLSDDNGFYEWKSISTDNNFPIKIYQIHHYTDDITEFKLDKYKPSNIETYSPTDLTSDLTSINYPEPGNDDSGEDDNTDPGQGGGTDNPGNPNNPVIPDDDGGYIDPNPLTGDNNINPGGNGGNGNGENQDDENDNNDHNLTGPDSGNELCENDNDFWNEFPSDIREIYSYLNNDEILLRADKNQEHTYQILHTININNINDDDIMGVINAPSTGYVALKALSIEIWEKYIDRGDIDLQRYGGKLCWPSDNSIFESSIKLGDIVAWIDSDNSFSDYLSKILGSEKSQKFEHNDKEYHYIGYEKSDNDISIEIDDDLEGYSIRFRQKNNTLKKITLNFSTYGENCSKNSIWYGNEANAPLSAELHNCYEENITITSLWDKDKLSSGITLLDNGLLKFEYTEYVTLSCNRPKGECIAATEHNHGDPLVWEPVYVGNSIYNHEDIICPYHCGLYSTDDIAAYIQRNYKDLKYDDEKGWHSFKDQYVYATGNGHGPVNPMVIEVIGYDMNGTADSDAISYCVSHNCSNPNAHMINGEWKEVKWDASHGE